MTPEETEAAWWDNTFEGIATATGLSVEDVTKLENVTVKELLAANDIIFTVAGFSVEKKKKEGGQHDAQGEA